ncbi:NADH:flavin oxidoreductase/NADH oxidase [Paracandidimonas soli]|uniref:2,4-dienoyl-CoA reductase-like NADH-dependent reductase (Old Yellow Enzyme family) n=1 Tax=Paracandidimonas soli TaxID=1917182 RepID=A0A4V6P2V4_9BURK|nr:NADH:flavin oxidoreductase/NADH oxidase [Paracandidimonas soli]TCV03270.1 2,4-dienoyl-CoA reductase-like NADH-dependent reductase (Old Yellow Enzyme family) [Paracandidimonas soli]
MTTTSRLFQPMTLNGLTLANRIIIAPMCQYSATEGLAGDWHRMHLGKLGSNGAGLLIIEATGVSPEGRITPGCLGLWNDGQAEALRETIRATRTFGKTSFGIQLSHAGRKGSHDAPFNGGRRLPTGAGGWETPAPSAIAFQSSDANPPFAMSREDMDKVKDDFASAARRAVSIGIELIELHMAHGYLLHQFLSPLANQRTDSYGGTLENRMRFPLEVFRAVRENTPATLPVGIRISATDWVEGGWSESDTLALCRQLKTMGCDFFHVSSGGLSPDQKIPAAPGYQVAFAASVKKETGVPTIAVGLITEPAQAERILAEEDADLIAVGRRMLSEPHWPWRAAAELQGKIHVPAQYLRAVPGDQDIAIR